MKLKAISSCREATRLMSQQLDHPLPFHKKILLKIHLVMCANCLFFGQQIKALKDIIGSHREPTSDLPSPYTSSLSDNAKGRIKSLLREE